MKIIIIGIGQVGYHIAEVLSKDGHDICVIDTDTRALEHIGRTLDISTVLGSGCSVRILREAGIEETDILIASSDVDEINLMACILAKGLVERNLDKSKRRKIQTIARVHSQTYDLDNPNVDPKIFGVDTFLNQDTITSEEIIRIINLPGSVEVIPFAEDKVELVGFKLKKDTRFEQKRISSLRAIPEFSNILVVAIERDDELLIPGGSDKIQEDDIIFFIGKKNDFNSIRRFFGDEKIEPLSQSKHKKTIFVLGANKLSQFLVEKLVKYKNVIVKIIDPSKRKIFELSEKFDKNVICLYGSVTDLELLHEEGIENADHVIAATDSEDVNIVASILCKEYKVKQTIAIVQNPDYTKIKTKAGIDVAISPKIMISGEVLKVVKKGNVKKAIPLLEKGAELLEIEIPRTSKKFGKAIKNIKFPQGSIVCAIMSKDKIIIPSGSSVINPGDDIVVFVLPDSRTNVENFFSE